MSDIPSREVGEFNSAVEYLIRINEAFRLCGDASASMNSYLWVQALSVLFRELSTKMSKDELSNMLPELRGLMDSTSNVKARFTNKINEDLYWKCFNFELFLRRVYKEAGLEMKFKADASSVLMDGGR